MFLLLSMGLPLLGALLLAVLRPKNRAVTYAVTLLYTVAGSVFAIVSCWRGSADAVVLFSLGDQITLSLKAYGIGRIFGAMAAFLWPLSTLYGIGYMKHEGGQNTFFVFYQMSFFATLGIAFAADLFTMYVFYELLTLATMPLIAHNSKPDRIAATRKYIVYMLTGASVGFIALAIVLFTGGSVSFLHSGTAGVGQMNPTLARVVFLMALLGFGVKAAIFPLHGWLPAASVAPTPVTALLHAVAVVKAGVFAMMRVSYDLLDASVIRGSWAQYAALAIVLSSILVGSAMAVREQHMKRRFAYSTMSNLSYILLGVVLLTPLGFQGALMHMVFHAVMKITLFCCIGAMMTRADVVYLQEVRGLSRRMPIISAIFLFAAVALCGIPPFIGFQSKWTLATAALACGNGIGVVCCAVLLLSAVLTAIYALTPAILAYCTPRAGVSPKICKAGGCMTAPLLVLCAVMLILAFYPQPLIQVLCLAANGIL